MNFDTCETKDAELKDMHIAIYTCMWVQACRFTSTKIWLIYCYIHGKLQPSLFAKDIGWHQRSASQFHPMCATSQLLALHGLTEEEWTSEEGACAPSNTKKGAKEFDWYVIVYSSTKVQITSKIWQL